MTLHSLSNSLPLRSTVRFTIALCIVASGLSACNDNNHHSNQDENTDTEFEYGDEYWASLAQDYEPVEKPPLLGAAYGPEAWQSVGQWSEVVDWPLIATGAANLPDGRVLAWSSQKVNAFGGPTESTHGTLYNPANDTFTDTPNSTHDMFCAGVSMLEDGRVLVAGGGRTVTTASVFDSTQFIEIEPLALSRWYPTSTTLPSGQVFTSLGTLTAPYPEIWTDGSGWNLLGDINLQTMIDDESVAYRDWYPALNVAPDGSLFHPGHMPEQFSVRLDDDEHVHSHGSDMVGDKSRLYNTTVMYDVGKMLVAGGGTNPTADASIIDLNGISPHTVDTTPMNNARAMQNTVVLPNGEVLVIGGNTSGIQFSDEGTVWEPELWNPQSEQWRVVAPHDRPRNYHSIAVLLKDARVLAAGGGLCGACATNHQNGEIFSPPYLFDSEGSLRARPSIYTGDSEAFPGNTIALSGSDDIVSFNMLRLVAITHHHTTDQRMVPVNHVKTGPGEYSLTLHTNQNVLIPGYYWIFGLDQHGTPTAGHTLQVKIASENQPNLVKDTSPNITYEYYEENLSVWELPDFDSLTAVKTGTLANFSLEPKERNNHYAFRFRGSLSVPVNGSYTFYLSSDDGSKLLINNQVVVDHDGVHAFVGEESGTVTLNAGQHDIEVQFFEISGGDALLVSWHGPNFGKRPIRSTDLGANSVPITSASVVPGQAGMVSYAYYRGAWNNLPNFELLTPDAEGQVAGFSLDPRDQDDTYGFVFTATLSTPTDGSYTFYTTSDDGSRLSIDGITVVSNDGRHASVRQQGTIALAAGNHTIMVEYFEYFGRDSLVVEWDGPGFDKQVIPGTALTSIGVDDSEAGVSGGDSTSGKLNYAYYEGQWPNLPDFSSIAPVKTGQNDGFTLALKNRDDYYGFLFTGKITVPADGNYTFYTVSDDGSKLSIDGQQVVSNDGRHPPVERQGNITLTAGEHHIEVAFFEYAGGDRLQVMWAGPGFDKQVIPVAALATDTGTSGTDTGAGETADDMISYQYFEGSWTTLPDFDALTPVSEGRTTEFELSARQQDDNYGFRFSTTVTVTDDALYTFYTASDDGSALYVNGQPVVNNDGLHAIKEASGTLFLTSGSHHVLVEYFERGGLDTLDVFWSSPGIAKQRLSSADVSSAPFD